ncbi:MAG TPA: signal peptidase II [Rectinemataceae bacterium]|nr:signal peptidase II [Rectinemataceae bacterium]
MDSQRKPRAPFFLILIVLLLDQATKALVVAFVHPGTIAFSAFGDFFWIIRQQNLGMAFSLLDRLAPAPRAAILIAVPFILVGAIGVFYFRSRDLTLFQRWALCGIAGGGAGNLLDRIFRSEGVVDFVSVKFYGLFGLERWPTFNVADSTVVVCAILLAVSTLIQDARKRS